MKKSFQNELIKRDFFVFLKGPKQMSKSTIDNHERAILIWQKCFENEDFARFGKRQAIYFTEWLKKRTTPKGKLLSVGYRYETLRRLHLFFEWLSQQPSYKSRIDAAKIGYLTLSKKEKGLALQPNKRKVPPLEDVIKVIESINIQTEEDQRDRALICFALLTGARISAICSMPMEAFDAENLVVDQNEKIGVRTKYSKRITTTFFPIGYEPAVRHFLDWYKYLEKEKKFTPKDPIFPQTIVKNGAENISYYNTGEVEPKFWANSISVRNIFQKRFLGADVPYYHPHTFRHLVVREFSKLRLTEAEKKALSQNLGHANVGTTFGTYGYGYIEEEKQIELIKNIKIGEKELEGKYSFSKEEMKQIISEALLENKNGESL